MGEDFKINGITSITVMNRETGEVIVELDGFNEDVVEFECIPNEKSILVVTGLAMIVEIKKILKEINIDKDKVLFVNGADPYSSYSIIDDEVGYYSCVVGLDLKNTILSKELYQKGQRVRFIVSVQDNELKGNRRCYYELEC